MKITITSLLIAIAAAAMVLAAFSHPSEFWLHLFATASFLSLGISVIGSICLTGKPRYFWIGFAVLAWMRFIAEYAKLPMVNQYIEVQYLLPNGLFAWLASQHESTSTFNLAYMNSGHLATLISGLVGGIAGLFCFRARERADGPATSKNVSN